jgi:hypothetical protein
VVLRQLGIAGGDDDGQVGPGRVDLGGKPGAGHPGHRLIGDDQVDRAARLQDLQRLDGRGRLERRMAEVVEHL